MADVKDSAAEPDVDEQATAEQAQPGDAEDNGASEAPAADHDETGASEPASLEDQLAALSEQLGQAQEQNLRTLAEMQNLRKRSERDVENAHKFGREKLINALLPVLDNLDRAIDAVGDGATEDNEALKALVEGVELTRKSSLDALKQFGVELLEPYGEPFDPQFHEAMTMVPSPTAEPNTVLDVLQKGYTLNGRLLRAAMVVVARAPE